MGADADPPPRRDTFEGLRFVVGSVAGIAALIYVAGGAVLALRLAFSDVPGVGIVGQLPREFLFSVGATEVVVPAVLLGAVIGGLELGQRSGERLVSQHRGWWSGVKEDPHSRRAYIVFYAVAPCVLITPALLVAIHRDDEIEREAPVMAGIAALAAFAALLWVLAAVRELPWPPRRVPDDIRGLRWQERLLMFAPGLLSLVPAVMFENPRYLGVTAAWAVALLIVLLVVWIRGTIGDRFRLAVEREGAGNANVTPFVVLSFAASALLLVPALLVFAAVRPLREATACGPGAYRASGLFVGETKERVYVGDPENHRLIVIPVSEVTRVAIGEDARAYGRCGQDGAPAK